MVFNLLFPDILCLLCCTLFAVFVALLVLFSFSSILVFKALHIFATFLFLSYLTGPLSKDFWTAKSILTVELHLDIEKCNCRVYFSDENAINFLFRNDLVTTFQ